MGELTESSNIAELIEELCAVWYLFNFNHNAAINDEDVSIRCITANMTEECMTERYRLIAEIDDCVERALCKK